MPVLARRRTTRALIIAAAAIPLLLAVGAAVISVLIGQSCSGATGAGDAPSHVAQRDIPASFLRIYEQVGAQYKIPWEILAGIGEEECDHGRTPDPPARRCRERRVQGWRTARGVRTDADRHRRRALRQRR